MKPAARRPSRVAAGVARALLAAGRRGPFTLEPLPGGGNNRVFRVQAGGDQFLAKVFFRHRNDLRDRLAAETSFLEFAWKQGIRCVPRPLAADRESGTALSEFVPGRRLRPREVTGDRVEEAIAFFTTLNRSREGASGRRLPNASEACFSVDEHLLCVQRRLDRLARVRARSRTASAAVRFIHSELEPAWRSVAGSVRASSAPLPRADRCISPSDFGFHNALRRPDGSLCFIDFEYAGWDDPAKTACDFFCQPAVPVAARHFERFVLGLSRVFRGGEQLAERVRVLWPIYQVKWCCILLNEFLPVAGARRRFASDARPEQREAEQLAKAELSLSRIRPRP